MSCIYCGRSIGAAREAGGDPFCTPEHRARNQDDIARGRNLQAPRRAGPIDLEFHSRRMPAACLPHLTWMIPAVPNTLPPVRMPIIPAPFMEEAALSKGPRSSTGRTWLPAARILPIMRPIAAGLVLGVFIWGSIDALRRADGEAGAPKANSATEALAANSGIENHSATGSGPFGWAHNIVSARASRELTDTFDSGMKAWGMPEASWAPGWSRHPDGYIRTGQLAVFTPSREFSDYRFEFFAQIEKKDLGWVVRAKDKQNYYAMKFTVIDPGLRPVIAIVHYPVIGGKPGRRVEIPLSVMVHNNEPYRVQVQVRGDHIVTSIEDQEVDSWTESSLMAGGVGFFGEADEHSRLYWMKLGVNEDFLGNVCAWLSGGLGPRTQTAAFAAPLPPAVSGAQSLAAGLGILRVRKTHTWPIRQSAKVPSV